MITKKPHTYAVALLFVSTTVTLFYIVLASPYFLSSAFAQQVSNPNNPSEATNSNSASQSLNQNNVTDGVNSSVEVIDAKRTKITELKKLKADLENKNTTLIKDIAQIQDTIKTLQAQSIADGQNQEQQNNGNNESNNPSVRAQDTNLATLQKQLEAKKSEEKANESQISDITQQVKELQSGLDDEVKNFRGEIVTNGTAAASYIVLIISYWIVYELLQLLNKRFLPDSWNGLVRLVLITIAIFVSVTTLFVAFAARLDFIFASLGVVSAALVVALQDLVSSFFAWILITTQSQYKENHIIRIGQDQASTTGVVTHIGFLRTYMNERIGVKSDIDFEQFTGKVLSFPNNKVFTSPLVNFSTNDPYLWYSYRLTITFESDATKAYSILQKYMDNWFLSVSDIRGVRQRISKHPQVYLYIAEGGPCYTIWFSAKIGEYRSTLSRLSLDILKILEKNHIELAYTTVRTIGEIKVER